MYRIESTPSAISSFANDNEDSRLREAAHDLQGVFFYELLKAARETIPENEDFSLGVGGDIFYGMLDEQIADALSDQMDSEIVDAIYRQLARTIDSRNND